MKIHWTSAAALEGLTCVIEYAKRVSVCRLGVCFEYENMEQCFPDMSANSYHATRCPIPEESKIDVEIFTLNTVWPKGTSLPNCNSETVWIMSLIEEKWRWKNRRCRSCSVVVIVTVAAVHSVY
jgi:hypothetical protein